MIPSPHLTPARCRQLALLWLRDQLLGALEQDPAARRRARLWTRRLILAVLAPAPEDREMNEAIRRALLALAAAIGRRYREPPAR